MSNQYKDLTSALILRRISMLGKNLGKQMEDMEERITSEMCTGFKNMNEHFDEIEKRLERLEQDVFVLVAHKKASEERLNILEKVQLPKVRKSIRSLSKKLSDHIEAPSHRPVLKV